MKKFPFSQVLVIHAYNPTYLGIWDQEDLNSRSVWSNILRPHLQNNQSKMGLALQTRSPEFKPQSHQERKKERESKMVIRVQKQTAWAPWLQNLAEKLEPHLTSITHQGESKLWHIENISMPHYTEKTGGLCHHQTLAPNLFGIHSADQTGEHQASSSIPSATPGINQHRTLGRLILPHKKNQKLNN
jgi:hypothetical protein